MKVIVALLCVALFVGAEAADAAGEFASLLQDAQGSHKQRLVQYFKQRMESGVD
jgi:hypothetical protein